MKREFSKRIDRMFNVWEQRQKFSSDVMAKLRELGLPEKDLHEWIIVTVAPDWKSAHAACVGPRT